MTKVKNPYLSVSVHPDSFLPIKEALRNQLLSLNYIPEELPEPHVSLSYVMGDWSLNELETISDEIAEAPFKMDVVGLSIVPTSFYGGHILSLELEHNEEFLYAREFIKENSNLNKEVKYDESKDFQAHISLFLLKNLTDEDIEVLPRYLEMVINNLTVSIYGDKFYICDSSRLKILEKQFKK